YLYFSWKPQYHTRQMRYDANLPILLLALGWHDQQWPVGHGLFIIFRSLRLQLFVADQNLQ
ncbi:MAG: hypothetical protein M0O99_04740, partial [Desulfuromonas thiophila]|nr:hypothetical protein [Desulfuromonas thiophila]